MDAVGNVDTMFKFNTNGTMAFYRFYSYNSAGLASEVIYGLDTANSNSTNPAYGIKRYYYTGVRLDSAIFHDNNGFALKKQYFFYTNSRIDSLVDDFGYEFHKHYFYYNANNQLVKDSSSSVYTLQSQLNAVNTTKWFYDTNNRLDSVYTKQVKAGIQSDLISAKYYYNSLNNYDSILIAEGAYTYTYAFGYQPSAFDIPEQETAYAQAFQPYPNPVAAGGILHLNATVTKAKLYAIDGTQVGEWNALDKPEIVLPINLARGLYIIQWYSTGNSLPKASKVLVQ